jgi:hypothetical protein
MPFKPEFKVVNDPKFYRNAVTFATREEAEENAADKFMNWTAAEDWRVVEVDEPATHTYVDHTLGHIEGETTDGTQ